MTETEKEKAMDVGTDPLVDDYLRRLGSAASALPEHRRDELVSEIREHLQEALRQTPADDQAAVRNALERLGTPEEIAAAAVETEPHDQGDAVFERTNALAVASVVSAVLWLAGIGAVFALVFGYRAHRQIKDSAGAQAGAGLAVAGIVLGWIGVAVLVAGLVLIAVHPNKAH
ncbi:MAG TPA: DUF4190 domain-containing protein [Actinocrinis sp.]|jgi:hypothetical protein